MKKLMTLASIYAFISVLLLFGSCQHESLDPCKDIVVEIAVTKKDATTKNDGSIAVTATGGKDFQFSLNDGSFQTSGSFSGLAPGKYKITARNSYGCKGEIMVTIEQINVCAGVTIKVSTTKKDPTSGKSDGTITVTASGGSGYSYSLNNGAFQAGNTFSNLVAGTYTVSAKTAAGCIGSVQVILTGTNPCAGVTITVTSTKKDPTAGQSDGTITASATGGTGFTYSLNNGAYQASNSFTKLAAGNYTITAKSSTGCTGSAQVTLSGTSVCAGVTITVTATKIDPTGNTSTGSINASASGSTGLTYSLNGGAYQATGSFTGLAAGAYTITVKNTNGCTGTLKVTLTGTVVDVCAGKTISVTGKVIDVTDCGTTTNNGSITVSASGSTGFTYNINNGTYQAGNAFNNLAAGTYTIGAKDAVGCAKTISVTVAKKAPGPLFTDVKNLLLTKCKTCHTTGNSGGVNFSTDCEIVSRWNRIQVTTTNGSMPPGTPLTAAEKLTIANWVNAGHTIDK